MSPGARHGNRLHGSGADRGLASGGRAGNPHAGARTVGRAFHQLLPWHAATGTAVPVLLRVATGAGIFYARSQWEAAPTRVNYFIDVIKSTALAFTLGVTEMMGAAQKEAVGSFLYFEAFLVVAILYWIIVEVLSQMQKIL